MINYKSTDFKKREIIALTGIFAFIFINALINGDRAAAIISAICGILYTVLAGKGKPSCYLFGLCGSGFYSLLSFQNALWGNLLLYLLYYIPMQILGYFRWKKHLKSDKSEIIKIRLPKKDLFVLLSVTTLLTIILAFILAFFKDAHPILDSITTIFSIGGMYLTVRRAVEQWYFWITVNLLSLIMWLQVTLGGARVWSTVIMWAVYLFLAVYFCIEWHKELNSDNKQS